MQNLEKTDLRIEHIQDLTSFKGWVRDKLEDTDYDVDLDPDVVNMMLNYVIDLVRESNYLENKGDWFYNLITLKKINELMRSSE